MKSFKEMFDTEALYTGEEDKQRLMKMTETQREKVLYSRYCEIMAFKEKELLREMDTGAPEAIPGMGGVEESIARPRYEDCDFIVSRELLVKNVFKPCFGVFRGSFVRARLNNEYKICKIVGIEKVEPYSLRDQGELRCGSALNLDDGTRVVKKFEIYNVRSKKPSPEEFEVFVNQFKIDSVDDLRAKYRRICTETSKPQTDEEITATIENRLRANPRKKSNAQIKIDLIINRDDAIRRLDREAASHYQRLLEEMEDAEREERRKRHAEELLEARRRLHNN